MTAVYLLPVFVRVERTVEWGIATDENRRIANHDCTICLQTDPHFYSAERGLKRLFFGVLSRSTARSACVYGLARGCSHTQAPAERYSTLI